MYSHYTYNNNNNNNKIIIIIIIKKKKTIFFKKIDMKRKVAKKTSLIKRDSIGKEEQQTPSMKTIISLS
jgi:hypothetical protein